MERDGRQWKSAHSRLGSRLRPFLSCLARLLLLQVRLDLLVDAVLALLGVELLELLGLDLARLVGFLLLRLLVLRLLADSLVDLQSIEIIVRMILFQGVLCIIRASH